MMMTLYPVPPLMQSLATPPTALFGIERLNRGYTGPMMRVRRASDSASLDCYSQADIVTHCVGSNGFVSYAYDQSGNGRYLSQATLSLQPKIYDSATGLIKVGRTAMLLFSKTTQTRLSFPSLLGIPPGSPAITTAVVAGDWADTSPPAAYQFGIGVNSSGDTVGENWAFGISTGLLFLTSRIGTRRFTPAPSPATGRNSFVAYKALNADASAWFLRQNRALLVQASLVAGTMTLPTPQRGGEGAAWGSYAWTNQYTDAKSGLLGYWNAVLVGAELDALEQFLERLRVQ